LNNEIEILNIWVGLRPGREKGIELEKEEIHSDSGKRVVVIHNCGHGPAGFKSPWGCARAVKDIIDTL
jgi:D-amino-acid oxidase